MTDLIQIKRSQTVSEFANISFGELAFTTNGNVLYVGSSVANVGIPIAGQRTPGTLTANQAIVVNASSFVDDLKTVALTVDGTATVNNIVISTDLTVPNLSITEAAFQGFKHTVTVSNNKFAIDGTEQQVFRLLPGIKYYFDTSDSSNASHPLKFSETSDGTHGGGSEFTTGITHVGTPGSAGSYSIVSLEADAPTRLFYYCQNHSGMGSTVRVHEPQIIAANSTVMTLTGTLHANDLSISNNLTVNGDFILRGSSIQLGDGGDVISLGATVNTSIIPSDNATYDLGSSASIWRKLFTKEINEGVDSPLNHKVDVLWKKIGFNKTRTDFITNKTALDETQISNMIIAPSEIWTDANSIASTKPASNTLIAIVYNELETTEDTSSTSLRTWKTNIINWIPPRFGSTYQITVYSDTAGSTNPASNGTQLFETGSGNNDEWYFDYQSGVLHFIGSNLPSSVTAGKSVFISGAKYNGNTGFTGTVLTGANLVNATITSLSTPLEVKDGGTGVSSFTANSVLAAANSSTMDFKTGSNGQVMIVTNNDVDFGDLDGGTY